MNAKDKLKKQTLHILDSPASWKVKYAVVVFSDEFRSLIFSALGEIPDAGEGSEDYEKETKRYLAIVAKKLLDLEKSSLN